MTVFVHTTLAPEDARRIFAAAPDSWRVFEAPVSGGPAGARQGSMTIFLGGPPTTDAEDRLLSDISGRVFKDVPAPTNLPVPPYRFLSDTRILIGAEAEKA